MTLQERLAVLYADKDIATTAEIAETLYVKQGPNVAQKIRMRVQRFDLGIELLGQNTWVQM